MRLIRAEQGRTKTVCAVFDQRQPSVVISAGGWGGEEKTYGREEKELKKMWDEWGLVEGEKDKKGRSGGEKIEKEVKKGGNTEGEQI